MKIKNIKIENLYGKYNFEWSLRDDINIIAGDNGSFKTTLLRIIAAMCEPNNINELYPIKSVTMNFTDNVEVKFRSFEDSLLRLKKEAENDELLYELATKVSADFKDQDDKSLTDHRLLAGIISIKQDNVKIGISSFKNNRRYNHVTTFDVPSNGDRGSVLDQQLEKLENEYAYYLSDVMKQLSDIIQKSGKVDIEQWTNIYAHNHQFIQIVNQAFQYTHKTVDTSQSKLQFKIGEELLDDSKMLSSGEKQFLILMLTVLLQRKEESILILDEPEISMHLDWQRNLIKNIQVLNPNCQIILATHSPGIIIDGWEQLVTNISKIISKSE